MCIDFILMSFLHLLSVVVVVVVVSENISNNTVLLKQLWFGLGPCIKCASAVSNFFISV